MAKPKARRPAVDPDDDDDIDTGTGFDPTVDDDEFMQALAELDGASGAVVRVSKVREGRRPEYVGVLSAADFSLQVIQDRYGGGEYTLTVLDGARRYRKQATVAIAQPLKPLNAPAEPSQLDKLASTIQASMKQTQDVLTLLLTRGQVASAPAADPQQMRTQLLQDLALMKGLLSGGQQGLAPDKMVDLIKTGMDIADKAGGGGADLLSVVGKAVETLGEPLAELIRQRAMIPAGQPAAASLPVAGAPRPAVQLKPKPQGGVMNMQQAVAYLVGKAAAGSDPGLYADLIVDNVPAAILEPIVSGDVVAQLSQIDPRVADHAEWFRDLGRMLSEALSPDDAGPGSDSSAAGGNAGDHPAGS